MLEYEITASFPAASLAVEAQQKLRALRVAEVTAMDNGVAFTATIQQDLVDRAKHLIEQTGGTLS